VKFRKLGLGAVAVASATALLLAGCSSGGSGDNGGTSSGSDAIISVAATEPNQGLLPSNTNETEGGKVLVSLFSGLVSYKADGSTQNEMAESITTEDATLYTIKIAEGHKFSNGEDVTAKSFVDAWNYAADFDNTQLNSSWFSIIEGFDGEKSSGPLSGLKIVDDYTFTVQLTQPTSDFPQRLGYTAYYPLPSVAYDDIAAFGENPIGNGPYKMAAESGSWEHNVKIDTVKNEDYTGPREAQNDGLSFRIYSSPDAEYADLLSDNIDVIDQIPDSSIASFQDDLGDRAVNQAAAIIQEVTIPWNLALYSNKDAFAHFQGDEGALRRKAISMAINRAQITETIFSGTRTPATDFSSPSVDGYSDSIEGADVLEYNPTEAKSLWAQADAISPWSGAFEIASNNDGPHKAWIDAVTNGLKNDLGIESSYLSYPTFDEFLALRRPNTETDGLRGIPAPFRSGWQADYPALSNFMEPLFSTSAGGGAGSNDGDYSNAEFDALLAQAASATTTDEANSLYQQAEAILFQDLPVIPLWYQNAIGGYSTKVSNVETGWDSVPLYYQITKG
jgi:oligopeptide transport system substrate-binding protein